MWTNEHERKVCVCARACAMEEYSTVKDGSHSRLCDTDRPQGIMLGEKRERRLQHCMTAHRNHRKNRKRMHTEQAGAAQESGKVGTAAWVPGRQSHRGSVSGTVGAASSLKKLYLTHLVAKGEASSPHTNVLGLCVVTTCPGHCGGQLCNAYKR